MFDSAAWVRHDELTEAAASRWLEMFAPMVAVLAERLEPATLDGAARFLAEHGARLVPGVQCVVNIVHRENPTVFVVAAAAGGEWAAGLVGSEWPVSGTLNGRALLGGRPVETVNAPVESVLPDVFIAGGIKQGRVVPLRTGAPLRDSRIAMGVIGFWRPGDDPFTDDDRLLMQLYGALASVIVHRSELAHSAAKVAERAAATEHDVKLLQEAAGSLSATIDVNRIYEQTVESAARIMSAREATQQRAALLMVDEGVARIVAEHDEMGPVLSPREYQVAACARIRRVIETRETLLCDVRVDAEQDASLASLRHIGVVWAAMAPITSEGRVTGVLRVSSREAEPFSEEHRARLDALANVAAMAIGNAERYRMANGEAQRLAELEDIKSEFLRLASHELRGPLALVRGYMSMFDDGSLQSVTGPARDVLPVISSKLAQMNRMVDDMLETARLEDRRLQIKRERLDLRQVLRQTIDDLPALTAAHTLQVGIEDDSLPVLGDRSRIETVIRNLIDNAVKYSPAGGRIDVVARRDRGEAEVAVSDQGIGVSKQDMTRLFERFGRIVTSENSHIPGTGLGLHLARRLARLHGGDVVGESEEGQGSTFRLRLPLAPE